MTKEDFNKKVLECRGKNSKLECVAFVNKVTNQRLLPSKEYVDSIWNDKSKNPYRFLSDDAKKNLRYYKTKL